MALPEMNKSLFFLWKIGEHQFRFHQVLVWKCRKVNDIDTSSGKAVCDCSRFKFEGRCIHTKIFNMDVVRVFNKDSFVDVSKISWRDKSSLERSVVIVYDQKNNVIFGVSAVVGNLNTFNLLWLISKGITDKISDARDYLNPSRIYTELTESERLGVTVDNDEIIKVGNSVGESIVFEFEEKKIIVVEEEFDDTIEFKEEKKEGEKKEKAIVPIWKDVKRPSPDKFYVSKEDWEQCIYAVKEGINILLMGASGSGKSELCYLVSQAMGREIVPFNLGACSEPRTTLIGNTHFNREKGTWFQESRFVKAVQSEEGVVLLDEITRAVRNAFNILLPLLDRQGYLALDESEDAAVIHKANAMCFMATANVGMEYTGTDPLDKALKERFSVVIDLSFPPYDNEVRVLLGRCDGLEKKYAERLVKIADHQRNLSINESEFVEMISTRMLLAAGTQIGLGISFDVACKFCIENHFSAEGGDTSDRTKVKQIVQKFGEAVPF